MPMMPYLYVLNVILLKACRVDLIGYIVFIDLLHYKSHGGLNV